MNFSFWISVFLYVRLVLTKRGDNIMEPCVADHRECRIHLMNAGSKKAIEISSCDQVAESYSYLCEHAYVYEQCCKTCEKVQRTSTGTTCEDDTSLFPVNRGKQVDFLTCEQYIAEDVCHCGEVLTSKDAKIVVQNKCCLSCRGKDWSHCGKVEKTQPIPINSKCKDRTMKTWNVDGQDMDCHALVSLNPCYCQSSDVFKNCCETCSYHKELQNCCIDEPGFKATIRMKKEEEDVDDCVGCSCEQLASNPLYLRRACRKRRVRSACCDACSNRTKD